MSYLVECGRCGTPLHNAMNLEDMVALQSQLRMSHVALHGEGYALNVLKKGGICPICGLQLDADGQETSQALTPFAGNPEVRPEHWQFLFMHTAVHLREDLQMARLRGVVSTDRYLLAHRALVHFSLAGAFRFGPSIGCNVLLNKSTSNSAIRALALLVEEQGDVDPSVVEAFPPETNFGGEKCCSPLADYTCAKGFAIRDGTCVVVKVPPPERVAEAHFVAVVIGADLQSTDALNPLPNNTPLHYFTLERTLPHNGIDRTMVGEWKRYQKRRNYGFGCVPSMKEFVALVERLWISKIWES